MTRSLALAAGLAATLSLPVAAQEGEITFAWTPNPQTPQVDIARARGYFEEAGLDVSVVSFPTGREGFEALLGGQVDIAFMAEFPAATGALREQDFAIIADLARYTGSRIVGSAAAGPLESPRDLDGRRIGTTMGTNVDFYLSGVLEAAGVTAEKVNVSPVDLISALARGDVDAAVPFPSFYAAAEGALGEDYTELRVGDYAPHYILTASPEMIDARSADLGAFLDALIRADDVVAEDPEAAIEAVAASMGGAMSPEAIATMWQDTDLGIELSADLLDLLVAEAGWIVEQGVINAEAPSAASLRGYFAPAPLSTIAPHRVALPE